MVNEKSNYKYFFRQCFATAALGLNSISLGATIGYPAILLPQLKQPGSAIAIDDGSGSWIASITGMSLIVGNFVTPSIMDRFGRKMAHYCIIVPLISAWLLIASASSVQTLIIGRIIQGISFGMVMPLRSVFIGEFSSPRYRGSFLTTVSLTQAFGIFTVHLLGSFLSWQKTALVCSFFAFVSFIMTMFIPESPSYLVIKGRYDECRQVYRWLRGEDDEEELEEMITARLSLERENIKRKEVKNNRLNEWLDVVKKKEFYKPIIIMSHAYALTHFSGGTTVASYSTIIISAIAGNNINLEFWMIALDVHRIVVNSAAVYIMGAVRRRIMFLATGTCNVLIHIIIVTYVYLSKNGTITYDANWLPLLLINLQILTVATGMVPLPSIIAGEIFPLEFRSIGSSISLIGSSVAMFLSIKTFPTLEQIIGIHGTYTLYAVLVTYFLFVILWLLPETKDKTLQQIEEEFRGMPYKQEEIEAKMSLQSNAVEVYKRKMSARRFSAPLTC